MRFSIYIFFLLLLCFQLNAQDVLKLHRKLEWESEPRSISISNTEARKTPSFKGAEFLAEYDFQPVFYETIELGIVGATEVIISNAIYVPLLSEGLSLSQDKIQQEIKVSSQAGTMKKKPVASVSFVPLRNNPVSGEIEKLTEFDLEIRISPGARPSAAYKRTPAYAGNSVLSSGTWHKISVTQDGIYKLDYAFLKNLGIDADNIDLLKIRIFGNGGGMLPEENADFRHDDLVENAIYVSDGNNNGKFEQGDYVLFYGQGPHRWKYDSASQKFRHQNHLYSDKTYYFINTGKEAGKRWTSQPSSSNPNLTVTTFNDYKVHELDQTNHLHSGRAWYGEYFGFSSTSHSFSFSFPNLVTAQPVSIKTAISARSSSQTSYFSVVANGQAVNTVSIGQVGTNYTDTYAKEAAGENSINSGSDQVSVVVSFTNPSSSAEGWLNYVELNARRNLVYNGSPLIFRDANSVTAGNRAEFVINSASSSLKILDVTNPVNVFVQQYSLVGSEARFTVSTDSLREFIAFVDGSGLQAATAEGVVENQNLHAIGQPDMIIAAHSSLLNEANTLADHHRAKNNLTVEVVDVEKIYNEFSSGAQDISAVRDFLRMMYNRAVSAELLPQYLLLFGDGSYDYKNHTSNNTNLVPTYQSASSLEPVNTFASDDYFGFLDDSEGGSFISDPPDILDIAIGRLPVVNPEQARDVVNKIIHYQSDESSSISPVPGCASALDQSNSVFGSWRNVLCFIGDDQDNNELIHMTQADDLAAYMENNHPDYNIDKIYLDAYPQQSTPGGSRYPDVNEAIDRRIFSGALIMNYTGHGGVNGWAHERILDIASINSWTNFNKLPLFVTATCEFSKFDDPGKVSAGELVLLNARGGAIAMVTTTRLVFAGDNFVLNNNFLQQAFTPLSNRMPTIGEGVMQTKNAIAKNANNRKFILLGDPAVTLAYPRYSVVTTEINSTGSADDTLKALRKITIKGEVRDDSNIKMSGFNGIVYPVIYDKPVTVTTLKNDEGVQAFVFSYQKSILYNGKASVDSGAFSFTFIVPKDIAYNFGEGKISYYADNGTIDANGYTPAVIGGTATDFEADGDGPELKVFMNDEKFTFGGITSQSPLLLVKLNDYSGINTVGTGIGHDITAIVDDNSQKTIVLNDYYKADLDNYQAGKVEYPLSDLEDGKHSIKVKAWDVFNNSTEGYTEFIVANNADLALSHVLNYPNPFTTHTSFMFEHNCPCQELFVTIQIMTVSGKVVRSIAQEVISDGFRVDKDVVTWDGLDEYGETIGRGVYVYKLNVRTPEGKSAHEFEKLVILR